MLHGNWLIIVLFFAQSFHTKASRGFMRCQPFKERVDIPWLEWERMGSLFSVRESSFPLNPSLFSFKFSVKLKCIKLVMLLEDLSVLYVVLAKWGWYLQNVIPTMCVIKVTLGELQKTFYTQCGKYNHVVGILFVEGKMEINHTSLFTEHSIYQLYALHVNM